MMLTGNPAGSSQTCTNSGEEVREEYSVMLTSPSSHVLSVGKCIVFSRAYIVSASTSSRKEAGSKQSSFPFTVLISSILLWMVYITHISKTRTGLRLERAPTASSVRKFLNCEGLIVGKVVASSDKSGLVQDTIGDVMGFTQVLITSPIMSTCKTLPTFATASICSRVRDLLTYKKQDDNKRSVDVTY